MTILVKNIQLIDGSGRPAFKADVLVKKKKFTPSEIFRVIGRTKLLTEWALILVRGFIDIDTESDHNLTLFSEPSQKDFLLQGITAIIGGQGGSSLAPLIYGSLESIGEWADIRKINVNWHTVVEFLKLWGAGD